MASSAARMMVLRRPSFSEKRAAADAAEERADVADRGDEADAGGAEAVVVQEGGVEVLGAVGERGEGEHQDDEEEECG